jgi:hypothetical protein
VPATSEICKSPHYQQTGFIATNLLNVSAGDFRNLQASKQKAEPTRGGLRPSGSAHGC